MTFLPQGSSTINDDVAAKQRTQDEAVARLLREILVQLRIQVKHQEIITDTEIEKIDVSGDK